LEGQREGNGKGGDSSGFVCQGKRVLGSTQLRGGAGVTVKVELQAGYRSIGDGLGEASRERGRVEPSEEGNSGLL